MTTATEPASRLEVDALRAEVAELRERVEALEREARRWPSGGGPPAGGSLHQASLLPQGGRPRDVEALAALAVALGGRSGGKGSP